MSGELHICLDPHDLNNAIHRDHQLTPTVDEVVHEFAHSKYFTKLDARHGYWAIVLNTKSSLLMTFNTPYGQYHFLQLPFGLANSQDVFHKRMDQILEECEGWIGITDDITVHGHTEVEHDTHLCKLMEVAQKYDLVFNPKKHKSRPQWWNSLDASMMRLESTKIQRRLMLYMPCHHQLTSQSFKSFLGMVTYLSPFIPDLSTLTAPLHELLKKDAEFSWDASYQTTFQCVKDPVVSDITFG